MLGALVSLDTDQCHEPLRIRRGCALLVIVEESEHYPALPPPFVDVIGPLAQGTLCIFVLVPAVRSMTADIDVFGSYDPG